MSAWAAKRFWKEATVEPDQNGFSVLLDGRPVKTPAKSPLILPTQAMADAVAREWDAQEGKVDPNTMPVTRSANAAIDKVATQHAEVAALLAEYGATDLLCYRAETPRELVERQAQIWDPLLDWAADALDARLVPATGVMFVPQDAGALQRLANRVAALDAYQMAAFHDLVGMSGSLVLAFATALDRLPAQEAWAISRLDETWQEEQWGQDDDATAQAEVKKAAFLHAKRFFDLAQGTQNGR